MASAEPKPRLIHRVVGGLLARYVRLVGSTSLQTEEMTERFDEHAHNYPCIVTMWHGQFMLLPLVRQPGYEVDIMLARHGDAELMGAVLREFGMRLIRGAGAGGRRKDRGGVHAFRAAVQTLREGRAVGMTADVPGGEPRRAGLGVVMIARASGKPIMPLAIATSRYFSLNTWSRMTINLPWSRMGFAVGDIIHVPRDADPDELEGYRLAVEASLNAATAIAYGRAGADPARATPGFITPPGLRLKAYRSLTALARPLAPYILRMRQRRGKEDVAERLPERMGRPSAVRPAGRIVWVHAASVGETISILPLIAALAEQRPSLSFLLTTGTVTSAQLAAQRLPPRTLHQYVPLDVPQYMRSFLDHWRPDLAILTESEIWPNLILEASERGVPLALVNARMTTRSYRRWRRNSGLARPLFSRFALVLTQTEALARRFKTLGATTARMSGNLKIDTPAPPVDTVELERLQVALEGRPVLLAAATHEGEDAVIAEAHRLLRRRLPELVTIIAPRHPDRGPAIAAMLEGLGMTVARRAAGEMPSRATEIYIADTLGELGTLYKLVPVAFIGGSLVDRGGHNPIEAIRHGAAVLTGPQWQNFTDTYEALLSRKAAMVVNSAVELAEAAGRLLGDAAELAEMRQQGEQALASLAGALPRTVEALLRQLPGEDELAPAS